MELCFPQDVLKQHLVVLGKTGAGKSSKLRVIVEHLLRHKKRVCVIDAKGDWWGLKSSADGKGPGFPIIAFGNFREPKASDVPINSHSGSHIAELIASGNRPCIIGFRGWMPSDIIEFWIGAEHNRWQGFASTLFNKNEGELYVVISECHNFAPKGRVQDPKAGRLLHWTNRLLTEGRGLGMTFLLDSQRPQKVHNDTLTSCETLVACRITYPADRDAIEEWINGCGDLKQGKQVLASLANLSRSEAWMWSPEVGFGPERVQFPMFETFDSFAPAQMQKTVSQSGWSAVDLDAVKEKLASVIEEAKENDPKELKAKIAKLERELASKPASAPVDESAMRNAVDSALRTQGQQFQQHEQALQGEIKRLRAIVDRMTEVAKEALTASTPSFVVTLPPAPAEAAAKPVYSKPEGFPAPAVRVAGVQVNGNGKSIDLGKAERAILTVLAQYPQGRVKRQIATLCGYASTSGSFRNSLGSLRTKGYLTGENDSIMQITQSGLNALGQWSPLPHGEALLLHWYSQLGKAEKAILEVVAARYPREVAKEEIAAATGYEASSGSFRNSLGKLRTLELISGKGELKASDDLFN